jgi:hypothetical protein
MILRLAAGMARQPSLATIDADSFGNSWARRTFGNSQRPLAPYHPDRASAKMARFREFPVTGDLCVNGMISRTTVSSIGTKT